MAVIIAKGLCLSNKIIVIRIRYSDGSHPPFFRDGCLVGGSCLSPWSEAHSFSSFSLTSKCTRLQMVRPTVCF